MSLPLQFLRGPVPRSAPGMDDNATATHRSNATQYCTAILRLALAEALSMKRHEKLRVLAFASLRAYCYFVVSATNWAIV